MSEPNLFPAVMGNEQETFMRGLYAGDMSTMEEPEYLGDYLPDYMPKYATPYFESANCWLANGGLVYPDRLGSSVDDRCINGRLNLELATPECRTPQQVSRYIAANERLLVDIAERYATDNAEHEGTDYTLNIQKRSVDSAGNRRGCHDNYSIPFKELNVWERSRLEGPGNILLGHLATRSFVSGAGHMTSETYRFAQKVHGLGRVYGYGTQGYMYRVEDEHGPRLEVRCGDINISPWAEQVRLGSTALVLALMRAGLHSEIPFTCEGDEHISLAKQQAVAPVERETSRLQYSERLMRAVDFQQRLAELAMDELPLRTDMPDAYWTIARELYNYCEDFRNVLAGNQSLAQLADRADWAAKLVLTQRSAASRRNYGQDSVFGDIYSQYMDLRYDHIAIEASPDKKARVRFGFGYKLRDKGAFRMTHSPRAVEVALHRPPLDTRAVARVAALKKLRDNAPNNVGVNWSSLYRADDYAVPSTPLSTGPDDAQLAMRAKLALEEWLEA